MKQKLHWQPVVTILSLLVLWEIISRIGVVSPALFPPPSKVAVALVELFRDGFLFDITTSIWRLLAGLVIGLFLGLFVGILTGRIQLLDKSLTPLFHILRALPPVAIIPVTIVWLGIGEAAKIVSISFAVFFPVWVNTHIGAQKVPQNFLRAAKTLTNSEIKILKKVVLPATMPFAIAGCRIGIAIAFIMIFASELAGASSGIGYEISVSQLNYAIDKMLAALLTLGVLAALADLAFTKSIAKVFPWTTHS
jgi:ABC-type nitrate/sulfonate/bicarbonate transport system permease component